MEYSAFPYTITSLDVGKPIIRAWGRTWMVSDFIGRIMRQDIGKRVYLRDGVLQVENDQQLAARRASRES